MFLVLLFCSMHGYSAHPTAAPAQSGSASVQPKCPLHFQHVVLHLVAEINRNENTLILKAFPTHE